MKEELWEGLLQLCLLAQNEDQRQICYNFYIDGLKEFGSSDNDTTATEIIKAIGALLDTGDDTVVKIR